jgi:hypothetical protein
MKGQPGTKAIFLEISSASEAIARLFWRESTPGAETQFKD